jgi:polysaccharide deacetylase family protein (PEP-CTERM system associated)
LIINALTFDVEDWFHATYLGVPENDWASCEPWISGNIQHLLEILSEEKVRATFFILGWIADRNPELVRMIAASGHEIASHSYYHRQVFRQTPAEFSQDLQRSINALQTAAGIPITGYRAPAFSIGKEQTWAFEIMAEQGIVYDSSLLPVRTPLYGMTGIPTNAHWIVKGRLLEIPLTTVGVGKFRIPISGGTYTRLLPLAITKWAIRQRNDQDQEPMVLYLHPWELDPHPPPRGKNLFTRWIHTVNKRKMVDRLRKLLSCFPFAPIREVFNIQRQS